MLPQIEIYSLLQWQHEYRLLKGISRIQTLRGILFLRSDLHAGHHLPKTNFRMIEFRMVLREIPLIISLFTAPR